MRISKIVSFSVVILLITVLFAGVVTVPVAALTDTMQFRYNAAHSGEVQLSCRHRSIEWKTEVELHDGKLCGLLPRHRKRGGLRWE